MARPRKVVAIRRIELRLSTNDPMLRELAQAAQLRSVELTQHIHDLLRSRYLLRHGQSFQELLWVLAHRSERQHPQQRQILNRQQIHLRRRPLRPGAICSVCRKRDLRIPNRKPTIPTRCAALRCHCVSQTTLYETMAKGTRYSQRRHRDA
jgi:hypothetical protein